MTGSSTNPPSSTTPPSVGGTRLPAVLDWKELSYDIEYTITTATSIFDATPPYSILPSNTASMVAIAVLYQATLDPTNKAGVAANAFSKWAWNFTIEGDLEKEPGLTLAERQHWKVLVQQRPAKAPTCTGKRPNTGTIELYRREKRAKIADAELKSNEIDTRNRYVTREELDKAKNDMKLVSGRGHELRFSRY
jgi:hypothetical protein